jgi:protoheme IX farnesyltransferase
MSKESTWRGYLELCKPRVVALMLLTAIVGMQLAVPGFVPLPVLILGTLGIAFCAGSAATINHLVDNRIDRLMVRTHKRPIPSGRIKPRHAMYFAAILGLSGMFILAVFVNWLTALLTFFTLIGYAGVYTFFLKRTTPQNIVIGGVAGAAPPLLGWTAVTGHVGVESLLLMLIIFVWTPPHFWSLSIARYKEYANAKVPMLPVTHGIPFTKLNILLYTFLLTAVTLIPYAIDLTGRIYLIGTLILDAGFIYFAGKLCWKKDDRVAMQTFRYSIFYLMALFIILLVDHFIEV